MQTKNPLCSVSVDVPGHSTSPLVYRKVNDNEFAKFLGSHVLPLMS